jgi:CBS domain-containing membrane protein
MPVVDDGRHVVGLITLPDLQGQDSLPINAIMHRQPLLATDDQLIDALLPALSGGLHHEAIVVDAEHRLFGMLTQTDLLAALWRGHVAEQVSLAQGGTSASVPAKATAPV